MPALRNESDIAAFVREARQPFEIVGGRTRRNVGYSMGKLPVLDVGGLSGIVAYEPEELIITVSPGTSLKELVEVLALKNQRLGFDPADWSKALGSKGVSTIGGTISSDAFGPGRLRNGSPRDSLLAFRGVNGLGEVFRAGAKVVKNVTGFDIPKLVCGAYGTVCILTELTFRTYPKPSASTILALEDVDAAKGFSALRIIAKSVLEPSALCYVPGAMLPNVGKGIAIIHLEGSAPSLCEKISAAQRLLSDRLFNLAGGDALLNEVREISLFRDANLELWRLFIPRLEAAQVISWIGLETWFGDLSGGLLCVAAAPEHGAKIRQAAAHVQGHAMLLRASEQRRAELGLYTEPPPALKTLRTRVKAAFDPKGLMNPGRLG